MKSSCLIASVAILPWIAAALPPVVLDTTIHHLNDRRLIVERTTPFILPDPPERVVRPEPPPLTNEEFTQATAQWRAYREANPTIHAGATVYRLPDGETVTHVTNWRVNSEKTVSFWSSADFSILAHHGGFTTDNDVLYSMLLFWLPLDIGHRTEFMARHGVEYKAPVIPEFPEAGPATWFFDHSRNSELPGPATLAAIQAIHDHYNQHHTELQIAYEKREAENAIRRAELEANPPQPRDIHLRVSRLTPAQAAAWHQHATRNGGAE